MPYVFNPNAKEFIPPRATTREYRHSGERDVRSLGSGEAGHRVRTHARQEGRECRHWLGQLHPVNRNQGVYRATKQRGAGFAIGRKKKEKKLSHDDEATRNRVRRRSVPGGIQGNGDGGGSGHS